LDSSLSTLSKLFTEKLFRIPDYQRGYSWTKRQLKDFWTDLEQLAKDQRHYTGVLTLEPVKNKIWERWDDDRWLIEGKNFKPYFVVDGQQRLTTIIILIQCILEKTKTEEKLNFNSKSEIQHKFVFVQKTAHHGSYVFGYARDNPSYECLKTQILGKTSTKYSAGESTIYTKNLLTAKDFFANCIKQLDHLALENLFTKLTQRLLFNVFYIDDEVDVHVAFETMNNRGLQLSNLELLKNRLIYLTTRLGESASNVDTVRKTINDSWKSVYYYLGKNSGISLNDEYFLFVHFVIHFGPKVKEAYPKIFEAGFQHIQQRHFYKDFLLDQEFNVRRIYTTKAEERLTSTDLLNYALDLKRVVEDYYYISFPEDSRYSAPEKLALERLRRLRSATSSREVMVSILLFLPQIKGEEARAAFLDSIERYFFIINLLPYSFRRKNKPAKISEEIVNLISKKSGAEDFSKLVNSELLEWPKLPGFNEALLEGLGESSYYGWNDVKYFLFEYEISLKVKAKRKTDKIDWQQFIDNDYEEDHETVEHILPQTLSSNYWKTQVAGLEPKQIRKLKNSLGNLVAISSPRNSSLRNRPFREKCGSKELKTGYVFGSYSENEVALNKDWGPIEILDRGLRLLDFLEQRWKISLGDRDQKKQLLGLDFLP